MRRMQLVVPPASNEANRRPHATAPTISRAAWAFGRAERGEPTTPRSRELDARPEQTKKRRQCWRRFELSACSEPAVGIEPTTARLRIECSTTELRWRLATAQCPGADSNRD